VSYFAIQQFEAPREPSARPALRRRACAMSAESAASSAAAAVVAAGAAPVAEAAPVAAAAAVVEVAEAAVEGDVGDGGDGGEGDEEPGEEDGPAEEDHVDDVAALAAAGGYDGPIGHLAPAGLVAVAGAPDVWAVAADMPNSGGALTGLEAQRKRLAQEHRELTNRIRNAERKRARLLERARGLSNDDLLQIMADRAQAKAKAKASAKAKGAVAKAKGAGAKGQGRGGRGGK